MASLTQATQPQSQAQAYEPQTQAIEDQIQATEAQTQAIEALIKATEAQIQAIEAQSTTSWATEAQTLAETQDAEAQTQGETQATETQLQIQTSTLKSRRTRGPTLCKDLYWLEPGKRLKVVLNEYLQPVGESAVKLTQFLGTIARNGHNFPIDIPEWRNMPASKKEDAWKIALVCLWIGCLSIFFLYRFIRLYVYIGYVGQVRHS